MYKLRDYLLSMQSNWMINHKTQQAVEESMPQIIKYRSANGLEDMGKTPIHDVKEDLSRDLQVSIISPTLLHALDQRDRTHEKRNRVPGQ